MFGLVNATVEHMSNILSNMCACTATGLDDLHSRFGKDGSSVISKLLTHIINEYINTGGIPDDLKMVKLNPSCLVGYEEKIVHM